MQFSSNFICEFQQNHSDYLKQDTFDETYLETILKIEYCKVALNHPQPSTCNIEVYQSKKQYFKDIVDEIPEIQSETQTCSYFRKIYKVTPNVGKYRNIDIWILYDLTSLQSSLPDQILDIAPSLDQDLISACVKMCLIPDNNITQSIFDNPNVFLKSEFHENDVTDFQTIQVQTFDETVQKYHLMVHKKMKFFEFEFLLKQHFVKNFKVYHFNGMYVEKNRFLVDSYDLHFENDGSLIVSLGNQKWIQKVDLTQSLKEFDEMMRLQCMIPHDSFLYISQVAQLSKFMSFDSFSHPKHDFDLQKRNFPLEDHQDALNKLYSRDLKSLGFSTMSCLDMFDVQGPTVEMVPIGLIDKNPNWSTQEFSKYCHHLQGKTRNIIK